MSVFLLPLLSMDELDFFKQNWEFSPARFEAIVQTANDAILISNENSQIVFANKKAYEIFRYQKDELISLHLGNLMPEKYRQSHDKGMQRFIQSGVSKLMGHTIEIEGLRKDATVFPLELSLSCWQEDQHYFFSGIIRDITQRKEQEKALQDTNVELSAALEELKSTEEQLIELNHELEARVERRTARLEEQKAELHNLFMQVPALIGILRGREGRVELFNPTFSKLWGNRAVMGKTMRQAWPELEGQGYFEFVEHVYDTGEAVVRNAFPGYIDRNDSGETELAYFDFIYAPYYDLGGKVDGVIIYGVDVTEHVLSRVKLEQVNKELAASEEEVRQTLDNTIELNKEITHRENFLSSIIDQSPVSTWIADAEGTQIRINAACMKLFGVEDAGLGLGKYNVLKDETLLHRAFYPDIQAVFTEGKVAKFEGWYNLSHVRHVNIPTGKQIYIVTTIFPIKDASGKVTNAVIQHEDITERVFYEQALKASEEQLSLITDALPVLIAYVTLDQKYKFVNKAYSTWFHQPKEEIIGKAIWEVVGHTAYKQVKGHLLSALGGEEARFEGRMPYQDVTPRDTIAHFIPHKVHEATLGVISIVTDISSIKRTQRKLIEKNKELQKVNADLDSFIYIASHDLRSPITNIEGLVTTLKEEQENKLSSFESKIMEMIERSIAKFKTTIANLTEVSRIQKKLEEQQEEISFKEILEDVNTDLQEMISRSEASIEEDIQIARIVYAKYNLRSILYNLLSNAIKYRSPERVLKIRISTHEEKDFIVLEVKDNGLGLSLLQQNKVFDMFKRIHNHVEGTGIGLYIVKRIVESRGGNIVLESQPDQGATFIVRFRKE